MNQKLMKKIAEKELQQREVIQPPNVLQECFEQQSQFIQDESKRKILCIPRRSGKSTAVAIYLIWLALNFPRAKLLYVNTTKAEARNVMWHDIFETIFIRMNLPAEFIESKNEIRFQNGSIIFLHGVDATPKEMQKLRGKKFRLAVIDECQSYTQDLKQLILQVLTPTLADTNATICLCGTPGNQMGDHYWYQLNKPNSSEKGWKFYHWTWKDNPFVKENMQKQVDEMLSHNELIAKTPWFRQEYLGEWVPETDARVYKSQDYNYIETLPENFLRSKKISFNLSLDLGYVDATAYLISAYNQNLDTNFYVLESIKHTKQTITDVANTIKLFMKKYPFDSIVVDAANLQAVEEMKKVHSLPLTAAEKQGKEAHIALMNSDFITKNIFIVKDTNQQLIQELESLIWDPKALLKGKHKEQATKDNHLTDALLYGHHASRHWWYKPIPESISAEEEYIQRIEKQVGYHKPTGRTLRKPFWEIDDGF